MNRLKRCFLAARVGESTVGIAMILVAARSAATKSVYAKSAYRHGSTHQAGKVCATGTTLLLLCVFESGCVHLSLGQVGACRHALLGHVAENKAPVRRTQREAARLQLLLHDRAPLDDHVFQILRRQRHLLAGVAVLDRERARELLDGERDR
eukprot:74362-Prymnesium_polylepis.1